MFFFDLMDYIAVLLSHIYGLWLCIYGCISWDNKRSIVYFFVYIGGSSNWVNGPIFHPMTLVFDLDQVLPIFWYACVSYNFLFVLFNYPRTFISWSTHVCMVQVISGHIEPLWNSLSPLLITAFAIYIYIHLI